jgi:hypothetical protein
MFPASGVTSTHKKNLEHWLSTMQLRQFHHHALFCTFKLAPTSIPLLQDLAPVTSLVHRRCGDPKAAVRRGALQLLEALLVMRASWQGYVRQLPGSADLALLEAATADPLVRRVSVLGPL